jgi:hypothetical protein
MRRAYFGGLTALLLFSTSSAYAQKSTQLHIDDGGRVLAKHEHHHTKFGRKITWMRHTGSAKPWFVKFTGDSPCAEGKEFGPGLARTCTINASCRKKGDPGCKAYPYQSATSSTSEPHDPEVIVDP